MSIAAFKGFDRDMKCRGYQYVEGETYEQEGPAQLCAQGFHAVTAPLDGIVADVCCAEGRAVALGQRLAVVVTEDAP